jgi:ParB family chromosome partitioning protein
MEQVMTEAKKNPKSRGLGRGLNALFEDEEDNFTQAAPAAANEEKTVSTTGGPGRRTLGTDQLTPGAFQPRTLFKDETLGELAESIKRHGLLQPILVRAIPGDETNFEIIAGERRWRAAQKAGLHEVPVIVRDLSDEMAVEIALIENLQREDLNPVDEAMGYKKLLDVHGRTQEEIADALGKSRPYIANMVRLLGLPTVVLGYLERGDLSIGHARALITAKDAEALAREVVAKNLSVRQTEALVGDETGRVKKTKTGGRVAKDADTLALEKDMSNNLGMRVTIDSPNGQSGKLNIEFKDLDQLDLLIRRLSQQ